MKNQTLYGSNTVENYITTLLEEKPDIDIVQVPCTLVDEYYINHGYCIEVFEEVCINPWTSALARHIYKKHVPERIRARLEKSAWGYSLGQGKTNYYASLPFYDALNMIDDFNNK